MDNNLTIDLSRLQDGYDKIKTNYTISEYYQTLYRITDLDKYVSKAMHVAQCYKYFSVDFYRAQRVTDLKHISLCHDKFCKNCQNLLSKQRYIHFKPYLDKYVDDYDIYHVTLTVPNVSGLFLQSTLDNMYTAFAKFIKIFRRKNCRHKYLALDDLGYKGCVRSLEITYKDGQYHPHFHCLFILSKNLHLEPCIVNKYSYSNGAFNRMFTKMEVTIQKLWYLIFNNLRISESSFTNLALGYSCTCDLTNYDYKEVFKYTLKESFDSIVDSEVVFLTLYNALEGRRIIQGYGCLFNLNAYDDVISQEADKLYLQIVGNLYNIERPLPMVLRIDDIINDIESDSDVQYISRNSVKGVLMNEE